MTRKHFVAMAASLKEAGASLAVCHAMADFCNTQNSNFDWSRFMVACGYDL